MYRESIDRSAKETYLIIEDDADAATETGPAFETQMLLENRMDPFLPLLVQHVDHTVRYRYPVTGKTNVKQMFEKREIGADILRTLIDGIHRGLLCAEEYMLQEGHILVDPAHVYWDSANEAVFLCPCPISNAALKEGMQELAEFLITVTDHGDHAAIDLTYGFFRMVCAGDYRFDLLLHAKEKETEEEIISREDNQTKTERTVAKRKNNASGVLGFAAAFAIVICFTLCLLLLKFR